MTEKPRRRRDHSPAPARAGYGRLPPPFGPHAAFSADEIAAMHGTALRVLENLGMRVLLDQARTIYRSAGALVEDETQMVRIGRDLVMAALTTAPRSIRLRAADPVHEQLFEPGGSVVHGGCACRPYRAADTGRRHAPRRLTARWPKPLSAPHAKTGSMPH